MSAKKTPGDRATGVLNELILRSIVDHAVVTMDIDGIITSWNEGAERILGWTEEEIVGKSADVFFTPQDVEENRPEVEMRLAVEDGRAEDIRWHVRKGGERFWGSGLMMPFLSETQAASETPLDASQIHGFVKIFRDRTAERNAGLNLSLLQDRAALVMRRSGTVGSYELDLQRGIVIADETTARLHAVNVDLAEGGALLEVFFEKIVEEDRENVRAQLDATVLDGTEFSAIYRVINGSPRPTWVHSEGTVQRNDAGAAARLVGIVVDVTEQQHRQRMQNARLEFLETVRDMKDEGDIASLASRVIGETLHACRVGHGDMDQDGDMIEVKGDWTQPGYDSIVGRHFLSNLGALGTSLRNGEKIIVTNAQTDARVRGMTSLEELGIAAFVNLPLMENGKLKAVLFVNTSQPWEWSDTELEFMDAMFDRTYAAINRIRSEAERDILAGEIAHRMKNVLAIAQVIVKQSLRHIPKIETERRSIDARLSALAGAQDVLIRAEDHEADILSVIETALAPHLPQQNRFQFSGSSTPLKSNQILGLSLALHELATNAAKYGALSNESGQVFIEWNATAEGQFTFSWTEVGGPVVTASDVKGFGSTILEQVVGSYFSGASTLNYDPDGVKFKINGRLAVNEQ